MKSWTIRFIGSLAWLIGLVIVVLVLLALMIKFVFVGGPELYLGMYIVLGIGVLLLLLMIMTIVFARLNLVDSKQALGLPEGSIRALIALILLLVFIVLSIYIFRVVGESAINDDGIRLAQQLITTLATLAVAVSGFYFGSTTVASARDITAKSLPVIRNLEPREGKVGEELHLKIVGKNFRLPKTVRLIQGSNEIVGTSILSSDTEIQCLIKITDDTQANTKWDLVVVNEDGGEDKLVDALLINPPAS